MVASAAGVGTGGGAAATSATSSSAAAITPVAANGHDTTSTGTGSARNNLPPFLSRRLSTYSSRDLTHPHNAPEYLAADDADAASHGIAHPYNVAMMSAIFVNYIIDTGALGLPYAFVQSGWLLSCATLIASGALSTATVIYTLETMARCTGILEWKERQEARWKRIRRRRNSMGGLGGVLFAEDDGDNWSDYEVGEAEEEQGVLEELGESLRLAAAHADLPPSVSTPTQYGSFAEHDPLVDSTPRKTDVEAPPLRLPIRPIAPTVISVSSDSDIARHTRTRTASVGFGIGTNGRASSGGAGSCPSSARGSAPSTPRINPLATGRGYPITSPAHDPEHVHLLLHNKPIHHLSYRRTDFTLMSQLFGGYPLALLTQLSVTIFSYVSLWATAAIFAQSVDTLLFQFVFDEECNIYVENQSVACYHTYYLIVAAFAVVVIFLSLRDLSETAVTQAVLTAYRFGAFFVMGVTCLLAASHNPTNFTSPDGRHPAAWSPARAADAGGIAAVNWNNFDSIFALSAVSILVQYNMPDVVTPMRTPYKRHARGVVAVLLGAILLCVALYIALALVCALTIGASSYPLITLNWSHYTGRDGGWGLLPHGERTALWAQAIKLFVMAFPVVNMVSCFPLIAISLAENLRSSMPTRIIEQYSPTVVKRWCRVLACVPPLLLTCISGQVDLIFTLAGFVAFLIQLIIPCLLQWTSVRYCRRIWGAGSETTPFSIPGLSHPVTVVLVLILSVAAAAYSIFATVMMDEDAAAADAT